MAQNKTLTRFIAPATVLIGCASGGASTLPPETAPPSASVSRAAVQPPPEQVPAVAAPRPVVQPPDEAPGPVHEPEAEPQLPWVQLKGTPGSSSRWGSGWLDLEAVRDFGATSELRISLGGTASTVAVRLLAVGQAADDQSGVIGEYPVPADRVVVVKIAASYRQVRQISAHGGFAWGVYGSSKNGPATVKRIEVGEPDQ